MVHKSKLECTFLETVRVWHSDETILEEMKILVMALQKKQHSHDKDLLLYLSLKKAIFTSSVG